MPENFQNRYQQLRGTAAAWTSNNTVLRDGEIGVEKDTGQFKIGDGSTTWNSLPYAGGGGTQGINDTIWVDPVATLKPEFEGNISVGDRTVFGQIEFSTSDFIGWTESLGVGTILLNADEHTFQIGANSVSASNLLTLDKGAFTGEIDLSTKGGTYYDDYDLSVSGSITFSIGSGSTVHGFSHITVIADGVTELCTQANLGTIFSKQYEGIPSDRILSAGTHDLYVVNWNNGVSLTKPTNNADVTAPTLSSFTIEDANKDIVNFESSEVITGTTFGGFTLGSGKTITALNINSGSTTGHYFTVDSDYTNGDGNDTIEYSGSGSNIEDSAGNALATFGSTTVTNNIPASGLTFTLDGTLTESPAGTYTKSGLNSLTDGFAVSTTSVSGAFNYRCEVASTSNLRMILGISTDSTNRAYNTSPAWEYGAYLIQNNLTSLRPLISGVAGTLETPPVAPAAGQYLELRRDASNNVTMWYDGVQYGSTEVIAGDVYLHFQIYANGNSVLNPETY